MPGIPSRARPLWAAHGQKVLAAAAVVMAAVAALWLGYELYRLFRQPTAIGSIPIHPGAIDLGMFHSMTHLWFAGEPVYLSTKGYQYTYLPASMALAWPVYGWASLDATLVIWTLAAIAALGWLVRLAVRESGAATPVEKVFVALVPLAIYPTGAVTGNGQLTLFVVALVQGSLLLLRAERGGWGRDSLAALLMLFALVKPTVAAPFFLIVVFAERSLRPALLVCVAYAAVTLFAARFQNATLVELFEQFFALAARLSVAAGEANLHILLARLGLAGWITAASLTVLAILGLWIRRHRHADLWLLMGVTAIAARFWSYHRWYDDLLLLVPLLALFRIAKRAPAAGNIDLCAGALFGLTLVFLLAPGGLYLLPAPWDGIYSSVQVAIWIADLVFLVIATRREDPAVATLATRPVRA